jgi:hypothetical protein
MGVIVWRDDGHGTIIKGNDGIGWSSDGMVLWLGRRQMETRLSGGDSGQGWHDLFMTVEGVSPAVRGGWLAAVVQIQCFSFGWRGEATWWSIVGRWSGGNNLILAAWEGSVTRHNGVVTSVRGDDVSWADVNLTGPKMKKINVVDSAAINGWWRFKAIMS